MKWLFFVANSSKVLRAGLGNVGGSGREYNLLRQIWIVSSGGTLLFQTMRISCVMFVAAVCILVIVKLKWPKNKSVYDLIIILHYHMAVSHKDWELPNSRIWLAEIDIDHSLDFPVYGSAKKPDDKKK